MICLPLAVSDGTGSIGSFVQRLGGFSSVPFSASISKHPAAVLMQSSIATDPFSREDSRSRLHTLPQHFLPAPPPPPPPNFPPLLPSTGGTSGEVRPGKQQTSTPPPPLHVIFSVFRAHPAGARAPFGPPAAGTPRQRFDGRHPKRARRLGQPAVPRAPRQPTFGYASAKCHAAFFLCTEVFRQTRCGFGLKTNDLCLLPFIGPGVLVSCVVRSL